MIEFSIDITGLDSYEENLLNIEKNAKSIERKVHVGIIDNKPHGKTTEAVIAAANEREYGWVTGIGTFVPPRSTIRLPIEMKEDEIRDRAVAQLGTFTKEEIDSALDELGQAALGAIQGAFDTQGYGQWDANAETTIKKKGSSQPMVDTGQLRDAYSYEVQDGN